LGEGKHQGVGGGGLYPRAGKRVSPLGIKNTTETRFQKGGGGGPLVRGTFWCPDLQGGVLDWESKGERKKAKAGVWGLVQTKSENQGTVTEKVIQQKIGASGGKPNYQGTTDGQN